MELKVLNVLDLGEDFFLEFCEVSSQYAVQTIEPQHSQTFKSAQQINVVILRRETN